MGRSARRIGNDIALRVVSQQARSQATNRELATSRFIEPMRESVKHVAIRIRTGISGPAKLRRLEEKKRHSLLKSQRSK